MAMTGISKKASHDRVRNNAAMAMKGERLTSVRATRLWAGLCRLAARLTAWAGTSRGRGSGRS